MGLSAGIVLILISIIGIIGCITALAASGKVFKNQRQKLLERIERE